MRPLKTAPRRIAPLKLALLAFAVCLLVPYWFLLMIKPKLDPSSILNLQLSVHTSIRLRVAKENTSVSDQPGTEETSMPLALMEWEGENSSNQNTDLISLAPRYEERESENRTITDENMEQISLTPSRGEEGSEIVTIVGTGTIRSIPKEKQKEFEPKTENDTAVEMSLTIEERRDSYNSVADNRVPESKILCDFSQPRSDTCFMHGDVRVLGQSSSIVLATSPQKDTSTDGTTWKIRPYARKWERPVMQYIREISLKTTINPKETPQCTVNHTVPAVVFSTGGFLGNFFHDFTDVLIPLFTTSRQYYGEVQFLATNFNYQWISKHKPILERLSRHEVINLDQDKRVHCFQNAHVGLMSHKVMSIDPSKSPNGYSMADFRELLRAGFSLKRKLVKVGKKKPRLLIMYRKGSRSFTNKREVVSLARSLGYKVVLAGPEETTNTSRFARIVNSCDVMMGVHGAGLANMVFLPKGATLIQIVPWGGLKYACRHDFGDPAPDMGIRYLEYEIKEEESSLIKKYPRDHPVFTDPLSIHRQGWNKLWSVFLNNQRVKIDVRRFRSILQETLMSLHQ